MYVIQFATNSFQYDVIFEFEIKQCLNTHFKKTNYIDYMLDFAFSSI